MLSIRTAAELLAGADSLHHLHALVGALGVTGQAEPIDEGLRDALALPGTFRDAQMATGPGAVRALLVCADGAGPFREQLTRLAARLQSRAPHVLWLVAAIDARSSLAALAAWTGEHRPPRVRCLVADRSHLVDSDAETVCALAAAACGDDWLLHLRWTEVLGRDALTRRFYRELEERIAVLADSVSVPAPAEERRAIALLYTSRLLFLAFLEAKGWLDGSRSFLGTRFDACMSEGGGFHKRVLLPLFFGTLNTPTRSRAPAARALGRIPFLNGGLFAPTGPERRLRGLRFSDAALGALIGDLFARYRFTAREEAATWSEAAVDPEMLGKAFESLMAGEDRRDSGAFFTPQPLVERVTSVALAAALTGDGVDESSAARLISEGFAPEALAGRARERLATMVILDPACGSGAFLVHALERVAGLLSALGDERPVSDIRRGVLTRSIFGVDRNPMAVWLCELRLWLSVVIDAGHADPMAVPPLPNLDRNVRVGDSLAGSGFEAGDMTRDAAPRVARLRHRYARASGARKHSAGRALDREERARALLLVDRALATVQHLRRERLIARRGRDLFGERRGLTAADRVESAELRTRAASLRVERNRIADRGALPFSFGVHFADIAARGGFDAVIGNPPWVRLHRIPADQRDALKRRFAVYRGASWTEGATVAHAGRGFSSQVDLSALFVERSAALLANGGVLALLLPVKLWRSLAGGGVRQLLADRTQLLLVEDLSDSPPAFDAAVYPSLIAARRLERHDAREPGDGVTVVAHRPEGVVTWRCSSRALSLDVSPGSPWLILPPNVRRAFDRLVECGTPLAESPAGRPLLGVKCGCNEAFVLETRCVNAEIAHVIAADGREGDVERALLRPVVRGETLGRWRRSPSTSRILWTHGAHGEALPALPPLAARWLGRWRRRLQARTDARLTRRWWSLFRTEGADGGAPRVVWADFGRAPRALVLHAGDTSVPLNTCYVVRCADADDARTIAAILNSAVAAAWLHALAEPARGGYRRFLGWTMARLPLPRDWTRTRSLLAPIAARCEERGDQAVSKRELTDAVIDAYGLGERTVAPLLAWSPRA